MLVELPYHRMLVLTEGSLGTFTSKTGVTVMRYRPDDIVGVLDSVHAGKPIESLVAGLRDVPIFARIADALPCKPDAVLIGIAPAGGSLPGPMRQHLVDALCHDLSIVSGLHTLLRNDPELATLARQRNARIHDVRNPGPIDRMAAGSARQTRVKRVLTVGTDCNIGKMVTALELRKAAMDAGLDAAFVPTGQAGIMIEGWGIAIDHVLSDFTAGAVEMLIEHVADRQVCFIEGQGSIAHPAYSGVTLSLVHGSCPDAMILCHHPGRESYHDWPDYPIAPITEQISLYEKTLSPLHPGKVMAVAVNTIGMSDRNADEAISRLANETGLPTADPVRTGCDRLLDAVRASLEI